MECEMILNKSYDWQIQTFLLKNFKSLYIFINVFEYKPTYTHIMTYKDRQTDMHTLAFDWELYHFFQWLFALPNSYSSPNWSPPYEVVDSATGLLEYCIELFVH